MEIKKNWQNTKKNYKTKAVVAKFKFLFCNNRFIKSEKTIDKKNVLRYNKFCSFVNQSTDVITRGCTGFDGDFEIEEAICGSGPHQ